MRRPRQTSGKWLVGGRAEAYVHVTSPGRCRRSVRLQRVVRAHRPCCEEASGRVSARPLVTASTAQVGHARVLFAFITSAQTYCATTDDHPRRWGSPALALRRKAESRTRPCCGRRLVGAGDISHPRQPRYEHSATDHRGTSIPFPRRCWRTTGLNRSVDVLRRRPRPRQPGLGGYACGRSEGPGPVWPELRKRLGYLLFRRKPPN